MLAHAPAELAPLLPSPYLDRLLLRDAQAYLHCRYRRHFPSLAEIYAWQWFYGTYSGLLRHWVRACHLPLDQVEDCLQDVWMVVMEKLPRFVSDGTQEALCSWLRAIALAKAGEVRRQQARHLLARLDSQAETDLVDRECGVAIHEERYALERDVQRVLAVLRTRVSALTFEAFAQHWLRGHPIAHIAAEFHESRRQISCRLYKAKQKFQLLYQKILPQP
jgi:RNA polymerase sigma factor (sigma-70 family)